MESGTKSIAKLRIENFPTRLEVLRVIDKYLDSQSIQSSYKVINQDCQMTLIFNEPDLAFGIVKMLQKVKAKNNLYSKMKVSLDISAINTAPPLPKISEKLRLKKVKMIKTTDINSYIKNKFNKIIKPTSKPKSKVKKNESLFLGQCPYLSEFHRDILDFQHNKAQWINKEGFNNFAAVATTNKAKRFIPNYVMETPSESPKSYKHREIHKEKWIADVPFYI